MRILQISSAKNFGGGERHLVDLCVGLNARGHEIFVAVRAENAWCGKLAVLPAENIFTLPLRNSLDTLSALEIVRFVKAKNVRIIHAHVARDYPIAALAARMSNVRLILTRHLTLPLRSFHKILLPKDSAFIAVSNGVRQQLLEQNILPPERIRLVRNGVDTRHFADSDKIESRKNMLRRLGIKGDCRLVGIAGEITAHKGQTDFVRAASEVLKRFPGAEFLIAGQDGSPQKNHQTRLEKLIAELGLQNKIHLLGWTDDVAAFFGALDVFVSASTIEPFGLVIAEAMASGCAVVATKTVGAAEIVEDGATGKLAAIGDSFEISRAICDFLSDDSLRRTFAARAQKAVAEKFSVERMVAETEAVYREIQRR